VLSAFGILGAALMVLGFASAAALLVGPLDVLPAPARGAAAQFSLWLFFLAFVPAGFTLVLFTTGKQAADALLRLTGGILLAMGFLSALGLFLGAIGVIAATGTWVWWLLFLGGILVGAAALLMGNRSARD